MKTRNLALAALIMLLITACSTSAGDTQTPISATPAPSTVASVATPDVSATPSPEPEMTIDEAGQQYLDIIQPVNDVITGNAEAWEAAYNSNDWQTLSDLATANLAADRAFTDAMLAATWPEAIGPYVDAVVSSTAPEMVWYSGLANATDEDAFWSAFGAGGEFDRTAAQDLRVRLGLANVGEE